MSVLIANIFSLIADFFLIFGASRKTKKETLFYQSFFLIFANIGNVLLRAWSGFVIDAVSLVRNIFVVKEKNTKTVSIILFIASVILSLVVCESIWGMLPVMACIVENYFIMKPTDDIRTLKLSLSFSCTCWAIYCFIIQNYVGGIFNAITVLTYMSYFLVKKN